VVICRGEREKVNSEFGGIKSHQNTKIERLGREGEYGKRHATKGVSKIIEKKFWNRKAVRGDHSTHATSAKPPPPELARDAYSPRPSSRSIAPEWTKSHNDHQPDLPCATDALLYVPSHVDLPEVFRPSAW
jgi:hypothetical protein